MCSRGLLGVFYIFVFVQTVVPDAGFSRQKRCIVIQKQSGTHGDSAEGDGDDDYRRPQPKAPMTDRLRKQDKIYEAEEISPEFQRLRKRFDRLKLKKPNKFSIF
ncbi:uncharacterized protein LOC134803410 [Cydia splendana]|uniref:uncharacterized protein LOC134803410 n=1 Tax=Cydia splendana TaxID=1100963 RepID=UPI0028F46579